MTKLLSISGGAVAGIIIASLIVAFVALILSLVPFKAYISAMFAGCYVSAFKLISLRFRHINALLIVDAYILAKRSHINIKFNELEAHTIAGGSCHEVVTALIKAHDGAINLSFDQAKAIDLSVGNVISVVESVINPKINEIPSIKGVTQDNYELEVKVRIAVKAKLEKFLGALSEETLQDKVTKYIVAKISFVKDYKKVTPYNLAEGILTAGLDSKTGYQLISVDIIAINTVRDINSEYASANLERAKIQAQIEADRQRNLAAIENEKMKARTQEMKTAVLEAEAEVPKAIAEAIRDGRLSVMDYYKLMNLQADTAMRRSIIGSTDTEPKE